MPSKIVNHHFCVVQNAIIVRDIAARASRTAMAAVVVGANRQAEIIKKSGDVPVATAMLAQSVHYYDAAASRIGRFRPPVGHENRCAVRRCQRALLVLHV